jgi:hypothetical protein
MTVTEPNGLEVNPSLNDTESPDDQASNNIKTSIFSPYRTRAEKLNLDQIDIRFPANISLNLRLDCLRGASNLRVKISSLRVSLSELTTTARPYLTMVPAG